MTEQEAIHEALKVLKRMEEKLNDLHSLMPAIKNGGYRYSASNWNRPSLIIKGIWRG